MIRPIDLQNTILAVQSSPAVAARAEPTQRLDAQAAQAAFVHEMDRRDEEVAAADEVVGNRVDAKDGAHAEADARKRRRVVRKPETAFEAMVDEAAGALEEPDHIVDFTA